MLDEYYSDVKWLKSNHTKVHYFGLGFIQLVLDESTRMHFYTQELPPITSEEEVHNHRYDFTSTIMYGYLEQDIYSIIKGDTHLKEMETCKEGSKATGDPVPCSVALSSTHAYYEGCQYFISHETFHRVRADNCITLLRRSEYKKDLAEVVRPVGAAKICPFGQKIGEERLWEIIGDML